jgi:serine/threonine protein kinase
MLARKKIQCNWRLKPEDAIEEVAQLQRLRHAHVVRAVGTYIMGKELSILLYPATDCTMESFLDEYAELNTAFTQLAHERTQSFHMRQDIFKFFRCLQSTIYFVHENLVKHMDIKPTNLLVQMKRNVYGVEYKVYLADFGNARSYRTVAEVETDSRTMFSRTYAAPEVVLQDTRGFAVDIFSLGCVYLEMLAVLTNKKDELLDIRKQNPTGDFSYQANLGTLQQSELLRDMRGFLLDYSSPKEALRAQFVHISDIILAMLSYEPRLRPTAGQLRNEFGTAGECCLMGPEPFEAHQ